jgi:voltage-gated potassium channel
MDLPKTEMSAVSAGRRRLLRYSPVSLLVLLILLLVTAPLVEDVQQGNPIEAIFVTLVLLSAVPAVGARRRSVVVAALLVIPPVVGRWVHHFRPDLMPQEYFLISAIVFLLYVGWHLLHFVMRTPRVNISVLCAGISAYLLLGFIWGVAYRLVAIKSPGAFSFNAGPDVSRTMDGFNAFYFSFSTLCTVGYGDIAPVSKTARMLTVLEAITGLFYVTILIARLVAIYSTTGSSRMDDPDA